MYTNTVVDFSNNKFLASFSLLESNPLTRRLQEFCKLCSKSFWMDPLFASPFHAEVWHTPEDTLVLCEIASRTGGGEIGQEFMELFGVNLDKTSIQVQCEEPITNESLEKVTWENRKPEVSYSVSWIWMYPKLGKLASYPGKKIRVHFVMSSSKD